MLTIRLLRTGKKNQPSYKVVVTDRHNPPKGGKFVEEVGFYNPKTKEKKFNKDRIIYWLSVGAQASDTLHNMLVGEKIIDEPKRKIIFTKKEVAASPEPVEGNPTAEPVAVSPEPVEGKEEAKPEEPKAE
ncbi:MAG: 30S ribosomal protein S16 [Candidatus Paceibacterota bacterium]